MATPSRMVAVAMAAVMVTPETPALRHAVPPFFPGQ
jgi:hypothetical protein